MDPSYCENIYDGLYAWCEARDFAGHDPFDGLNSEYFQKLPLRHLAPARLAFLQLVKRSSKDLRPLLKVGEGVNPKGIALFALAELSRFRATGNDIHRAHAKRLLRQLSELRLPLAGEKAAWGYNFDWQSRAFFAPRGTPTIVPTAFAAKAFAEDDNLMMLRGVCEFIEKDLNRVHETEDEVCFSYTPLDRSIIFNASLLAAECLAELGARTGDAERSKLAEKAVNFVVRRQRDDGGWVYGPKLRHGWVDNFHTAYILLSIHRIGRSVPSVAEGTRDCMRKGLDFWLERLFLADGTPKYFDTETYPVDIHSASAAVVALSELSERDERCRLMASKVLKWTCDNMRDPEGYFYYQVRKNGVIKTPFIRWGEGWMAYAIARHLELNGKA